MASAMTYITLFRDLIITIVNLAVGRLLPSLKVPQRDLRGKVALVTGANSGIGYSIVEQLAAMGCTVYLACRNSEKGQAAIATLRQTVKTPTVQDANGSPELHLLQLDTASLTSVRSLVSRLPSGLHFDYIYHNAGTPGVLNTFTPGDALEATYQSNFLSSFLLTHLLDTQAHLSPDARIIFTSSAGQAAGSFSPSFALASAPQKLECGFHYNPYTPILTPSVLYGNTKLMQCCAAKLLQRHFAASGSRKSAYAFSPGYCATPIFGKMQDPSNFLADPAFFVLAAALFFAVPVREGAATGVWLASADVGNDERGCYFERCMKRLTWADIAREELLDRLWIRWCADAQIQSY